MKIKPSYILLTLTSIITLILLAVLVLGVWDIRVKNRQASELLNSADRIADNTVLAQFVNTVRSSEQANIEALNTLVLSSDKLVSLIETIESAGQSLGIETEIMSVERIDNKKKDEPAIIRIVIENTGPWAGTFAFFRSMEYLPHRVLIDELNFAQNEDQWQSRVVLSLHSFD